MMVMAMLSRCLNNNRTRIRLQTPHQPLKMNLSIIARLKLKPKQASVSIMQTYFRTQIKRIAYVIAPLFRVLHFRLLFSYIE